MTAINPTNPNFFPPGGPTLQPDPTIIPGQHIISFNHKVNPANMAKLLQEKYGAQVQHVYNVQSLKGVAISISDKDLARFQADQKNNITDVQPNRSMHVM